jgi:hypothetical protein
MPPHVIRKAGHGRRGNRSATWSAAQREGARRPIQTNPAETLSGSAPAVTSIRWLVAHYLALLGFLLLVCALPALGAMSRALGGVAQ